MAARLWDVAAPAQQGPGNKPARDLQIPMRLRVPLPAGPPDAINPPSNPKFRRPKECSAPSKFELPRQVRRRGDLASPNVGGMLASRVQVPCRAELRECRARKSRVTHDGGPRAAPSRPRSSAKKKRYAWNVRRAQAGVRQLHAGMQLVVLAAASADHLTAAMVRCRSDRLHLVAQ